MQSIYTLPLTPFSRASIQSPSKTKSPCFGTAPSSPDSFKPKIPPEIHALKKAFQDGETQKVLKILTGIKAANAKLSASAHDTDSESEFGFHGSPFDQAVDYIRLEFGKACQEHNPKTIKALLSLPRKLEHIRPTVDEYLQTAVTDQRLDTIAMLAETGEITPKAAEDCLARIWPKRKSKPHHLVKPFLRVLPLSKRSLDMALKDVDEALAAAQSKRNGTEHLFDSIKETLTLKLQKKANLNLALQIAERNQASGFIGALVQTPLSKTNPEILRQRLVEAAQTRNIDIMSTYLKSGAVTKGEARMARLTHDQKRIQRLEAQTQRLEAEIQKHQVAIGKSKGKTTQKAAKLQGRMAQNRRRITKSKGRQQKIFDTP